MAGSPSIKLESPLGLILLSGAMAAVFFLGSAVPPMDFLRWGIPAGVLVLLAVSKIHISSFLLFLSLLLVWALFGGGRSGVVETARYAAGYVSPGVCIYIFMKSGWKGFRLVASSCMLYILSALLILFAVSHFTGTNIVEVLVGNPEELKKAASAWMSSEKTSLETQQMLEYALMLLPASLVINSMIITAFTVWLTEPLMRRFGKDYKDYNVGFNPSSLKLPDKLVWVLIAVMAATAVGMSSKTNSVYYISLNCLVVLLALYLAQGLAILAHFFQRIPGPPGMKVLMLLGAVFLMMPLTVIGSLLLGILDFYFDFRKTKSNSGVEP